jgi:hypothetical protein
VLGRFGMFRIGCIMHPQEINETKCFSSEFLMILEMFEQFIRFKRLFQSNLGNQTPREEKYEQE